jgi:hypothetical protein
MEKATPTKTEAGKFCATSASEKASKIATNAMELER